MGKGDGSCIDIDRRSALEGIASICVGATAGCVDRLGGAAGGSDLTIDVVDEAPIDRPVEIVLEGAPTGETATVVAETSVPETGNDWRAEATFEVRDDGTVAPNEQAPIEGDYEGVDGMGLFWSMETDVPESEAQFGWDGYDVELSVTVSGRDDPLAQATTSLVYPDIPTESFEDDVVGTIHQPPDAGEAPAVLLLHGSGGLPLDRHAQLLADRGFVAGALHYFGAPGSLPDQLAEIPLEYVERGIDQLLDHASVTGSGVGLYGQSKGGELAFLAGAHLDTVDAIASVCGSGLVWEGLDMTGFQPTETSSWTVDDEPVSYVPYTEYDPYDDTSSTLYELAIEEADPETLEAATIPIEQTDAPIIAVSGGDDKVWPSEPFTERALDRLDETAHEYEHLVYEEAGHSIGPPFRPTYGASIFGQLERGGTPEAYAEANRDYWSHIVEFFEGALG